MDFMTAVKTCFTKYADFNGRASRSEFWWFSLAIVVANFVLSSIPFLGWIVGLVFCLGTLIPSLAVGARRLHDINKSGWLQLLLLIPILGWIGLIYFFVQPSSEANQYGSPAVLAM